MDRLMQMSGTLQRFGRYQGPEKLPMCENNCNESNLAKLAVSMVRWGCPKHIGNNSDGFDNWYCLNLSKIDTNTGYWQNTSNFDKIVSYVIT